MLWNILKVLNCVNNYKILCDMWLIIYICKMWLFMLIVYCWDMLLNVVYGVFLYVDVL